MGHALSEAWGKRVYGFSRGFPYGFPYGQAHGRTRGRTYGFLVRISYKGNPVETGPQWVGGGRTENILSRAHFQLNLGRKWGPKKGSERCQKRVKQRGRMGVQGRGWGYV